MKRQATLLPLIVLIAALFAVAACGKETDDTPQEIPESYLPLAVGKYIRYQLDSLVFTGNNDQTVTRSYQAKDVVEGTGTDLTNQPTWRVQRYLRPLNSTNEADWKATLTYEIVKGSGSIDLIENNLHFMKLHTPVVEGRTFHGNGYLSSSPYYNTYKFSITSDMDRWESTYEDFGPATVNGQLYDSTITVTMINDSLDVPIVNYAQNAQKTVWIEKYAKNIGLIYRDVLLWEYIAPALGSTSGNFTGFGLRMSILDHN